MKMDTIAGLAAMDLTSARHDVLDKFYGQKFSESFDNSLNDEVVYIGKHKLTDKIEVQNPKSDPDSYQDPKSGILTSAISCFLRRGLLRRF
jgi:hypothetical protein